MKRKIIILLLSLLLSELAFAQSACDIPEHRQFDFWLGKWNVTGANGQIAGQNNITAILNGCVVAEHYVTPSGFEGRSLNGYDKQRQEWVQTWMDNSGLVLRLAGQFKDGAMVLSGVGKDAQGRDVDHQITWSSNSDGTVRQHWQMRLRGQDSWSTLFDGTYTKVTSQ